MEVKAEAEVICEHCGVVSGGPSDTLADFLPRLLEFDNFVTRDQCGNWIPEIAQVHFWSDVSYGVAYICVSMTIFVSNWVWRVPLFSNRWLAVGFMSFIFFCGVDHLLSAMSFRAGMYDWQAITKLLGAITSAVCSVYAIGWVFSCYRRRLLARYMEGGGQGIDQATVAEFVDEFGELSRRRQQIDETLSDAKATMQSVRELAEATRRRIEDT